MTETPRIAAQEPVAPRRLVRPRDGRMLGGVAAALGDYFDISPTVYRLAFAALALAGGTGVLLYGAAWLVIPEAGEDASIAERAIRDRRDRPGLTIGVALLALALIVAFSHAPAWPHPGNLWLAALLVGGGLIWWELHGRRGPRAVEAPATALVPAPAPRPASLFAPVVGLLVAGVGVLGLLALAGVDLFDGRIAIAAAVVVVGVAIAAGAVTGRAVSGLIWLAILLVAALAVTLSVHVPLRGKVGTSVVRPASSAAVETTYRGAIGNLTVDLRETDLVEGVTHVDASLGIGDLRIHVPDGVTVEVTAHAQAGDITALGQHVDGVDADKHLRAEAAGSAKTVVIDATVGVGQITVDRG